MCDDITEEENRKYLLNRRQISLGAGSAAAAFMTGCATGSQTKMATQTDAEPDDSAVATAAPNGRIVTIETPDGVAEGVFVTPAEGKHPAVILWPDVAGLRPAYHTMAARLAEAGYATLAVHHYYRTAKYPILNAFSEWRTDEGREKIRPAREALTQEAIARDATAYVAWLDQQTEVDTHKKIATTGYCMGGPFTFITAATVPDRIGVIGSFHGGGLVKDDPSSPHLMFPKMKAAALICIAQNDDERQPDAKHVLRQAAEDANIPAEIEVYAANHGWCAIDSPVYDESEANRAWARMLATFEQYL